MNKKHTVASIKASKNKTVLSMITAYDALFAKLFDPIVDMILVGDSLNMTFYGKNDTLSATLEQMIYHTQAVCNGAKNSFIICDMPFGTYTTKEEALENCIKVYKETTADAVKIEGGAEKAEIIKHLTDNAIAVMGHIGLMPQYVRFEGGYKVKGKEEKEIEKLICDAKAVEDAGAFCLVIEGVKPVAAQEVAKSLHIPVIGIGAGAGVDGQVLVWSDMLGFFEDFKPKFVKRYLNGAELVKNAVKKYDEEVKSGSFPNSEHSY
ncbi:3-methyl-2-oxobutanoate hydroxymethyltransferase [Nitrosophilus alvini]|uniref:3-methyl-2-oxobutanoate hydroxymethyltransferase n=1 Tax=Nitrosophilus alvini TaxID=2714855 RepID=UPI00190BB42C|nr:3-methyl-2-oxobutanoate hydroxymethyltransferase [Nitrosophilus alvini]